MKTKNIIIATLISTLAISGCGRAAEPAPDTHTTIDVTADELMPELTDEDLGIERYDISELEQIVGYQSWNGFNYLVLSPADGSEGRQTLAIDDKDLFDALYDARRNVYLKVSYASVDTSDPLYSSYAFGLRSLGDNLYSFIGMEDEAPAEDITTDESTDTDTPAEDTSETISDDASLDNAETLDVAEIDADDTDNEDISEETDENFQESLASQMEAQARMSAAIDEYMKSVSLNKATKITVCNKECAGIGEMTPQKIRDYVDSLDIAPTEISPVDGIVYLSDIEDGIEYTYAAANKDTGEYQTTIKNDTKYPVVMEIKTENLDKKVVLFKNYLSTDASPNAAFINDLWSGSGSDEIYNIKVRFFNSDADLAGYLSQDFVFHVGGDTHDTSPDVQKESTYDAAINTGSTLVYIKTDTGDGTFLKSGEAIGLHKAAYSWISWSESTE